MRAYAFLVVLAAGIAAGPVTKPATRPKSVDGVEFPEAAPEQTVKGNLPAVRGALGTWLDEVNVRVFNRDKSKAVFEKQATAMLRREAEKARRQAVEKMNRRWTGYRSQGSTNGAADKAAVMAKLIERVENEREGAFSVLSQHPFLAAVLLPTGSVGLWVLVEYAAKALT